MRRRRLFSFGATHDHALAIGAADHDFPFFLWRRQRTLGTKILYQLRHLHVHAFQTVHRLLQSQHARHRAFCLAERFFHTQALIPILQQIGKHALRQLQPIVQRHKFDLLTSAAAVNRAPKLELPKNRHVTATMQFLQPLAHATIAQGDALALIARSQTRQELANRRVAYEQNLLPNDSLNLINRRAFLSCLADRAQHFFENREQLAVFPLENILFMCHLHHEASFGRDIAADTACLALGGPFAYHL